MMIILYGIVIFVATCSGAIAGLGGGVIIKPVLDFIGYHDVKTISLLSSLAVFVMATTSLISQKKNVKMVDKSVIALVCVGSVVGGWLGSSSFKVFLSLYDSKQIIQIQSILMIVSLVVLLGLHLKKEIIKIQIKYPVAIFVGGLGLGMLSTFLGIGGGPFNMIFFTAFLKIEIKKATVYSMVSILFSQATNLLLSVSLLSALANDLVLLAMIFMMGYFGGRIGTGINHRMDQKKIQNFFSIMILILIGICLLNI